MPITSELPGLDSRPTATTGAAATSSALSPAEATLVPPQNDGMVETGHEEDESSVVQWTVQELRELLDEATALKIKGNAEFGHGQPELALASYRDALGILPPASSQDKGKGKAVALDASGSIPESSTVATAKDLGEANISDADKLKDISALRAILYANVAACLLKLNRWREAVTACDQALNENPDSFKALHRKALANESIGSWSSLSAALDDFNKLATLPDLTPLLSRQVKEAQTRLPKLIEVQQQKEKDEVLGKLKNLGNTVLGKFGFSLDQFKMTEQPGGGYSMSFQQ
ncbi:uncharacterized protein JCM15063_005989 [Sporobolomyces koalae]|uniref:uncharacterized protein n=1 Tax=Sporobolomyces koalae TaxID=500713 RepID=UPI0031745DAE